MITKKRGRYEVSEKLKMIYELDQNLIFKRGQISVNQNITRKKIN